jgi:hypothetical protein
LVQLKLCFSSFRDASAAKLMKERYSVLMGTMLAPLELTAILGQTIGSEPLITRAFASTAKSGKKTQVHKAVTEIDPPPASKMPEAAAKMEKVTEAAIAKLTQKISGLSSQIEKLTASNKALASELKVHMSCLYHDSD